MILGKFVSGSSALVVLTSTTKVEIAASQFLRLPPDVAMRNPAGTARLRRHQGQETG